MPRAKRSKADASLSIVHPLTPAAKEALSTLSGPQTRARTRAKRKLDEASDATCSSDIPPAPKRARKSDNSGRKRKGTTRARESATKPPATVPDDENERHSVVPRLEFYLPFEGNLPPDLLGGLSFTSVDPYILDRLGPEYIPLSHQKEQKDEDEAQSVVTNHLLQQPGALSIIKNLRIRRGALHPRQLVFLIKAAPHLKKLVLEEITLTGALGDIVSAMSEQGLRRRTLEHLEVTYDPKNIDNNFFKKVLAPFAKVECFEAKYVASDPPEAHRALLRPVTGIVDWFQGTIAGEGPWPLEAVLEYLQHSTCSRERITHLSIDGGSSPADIPGLLARLKPVQKTLEYLTVGGGIMTCNRPVFFHYTFLRECPALQELGIHLPLASWIFEHPDSDLPESLWNSAVDFLRVLYVNPSVPDTLRKIRIIIHTELGAPPEAIPTGGQSLATILLDRLATVVEKLLRREDQRWDVVVDLPPAWRRREPDALSHSLFRLNKSTDEKLRRCVYEYGEQGFERSLLDM